MLSRILPHEETFFKMFVELAENVNAGAKAMADLLENFNNVAVQVEVIKSLEHKGDNITHAVMKRLDQSFITPFDREDIHELGSSIDDVLDELDGSAGRMVLYKVKTIPPSVVKLVDVLQLSIEELHRGVHLLRNIHQTEELQKVLQKVNEYENEADSVFQMAVADLFRHEKNPIELIKIKEVLVGLETATDKCEDAANVMEGILIKHA